MALSPLGNSDHVVASVPTDFKLNSKGDSPFHYIAMIIFVLIGMVFVIISVMFHGKISLNLVILLLIV